MKPISPTSVPNSIWILRLTAERLRLLAKLLRRVEEAPTKWLCGRKRTACSQGDIANGWARWRAPRSVAIRTRSHFVSISLRRCQTLAVSFRQRRAARIDAQAARRQKEGRPVSLESNSSLPGGQVSFRRLSPASSARERPWESQSIPIQCRGFQRLVDDNLTHHQPGSTPRAGYPEGSSSPQGAAARCLLLSHCRQKHLRMRRLIHAKVSPHTFAPDDSRGFGRFGSVEDDADGRGQVRKRWVQTARFRLPRPGPAV